MVICTYDRIAHTFNANAIAYSSKRSFAHLLSHLYKKEECKSIKHNSKKDWLNCCFNVHIKHCHNRERDFTKKS